MPDSIPLSLCRQLEKRALDPTTNCDLIYSRVMWWSKLTTVFYAGEMLDDADSTDTRDSEEKNNRNITTEKLLFLANTV